MFEKWFNERWFLRIVAVALAVMLYLMVAGSNTTGKSDAASLLPIAGQGSTKFDVRSRSSMMNRSGSPIIFQIVWK